jgi:hypothetical protein
MYICKKYIQYIYTYTYHLYVYTYMYDYTYIYIYHIYVHTYMTSAAQGKVAAYVNAKAEKVAAEKAAVEKAAAGAQVVILENVTYLCAPLCVYNATTGNAN